MLLPSLECGTSTLMDEDRGIVFLRSSVLKVSSNFAEAANSKKEGETSFDAKLGDLEKHLNKTEKQLLGSQVKSYS